MTWGLLGPEKIEDTRRARTLGLAAAVREFNDLAVPGLGGVWFGKQLVLATLGVWLAEQVVGRPISNITMANAVEALACGLALRKSTDDSPLQDARLRGSTKLRGKNDFSYKLVSKTGFYVTQPMRMATVQTLPALGLVTSDARRFNAFTCTEQGEALIEAAFGKRLVNLLNEWVLGKRPADSNELRKALSPLEPMPDDAKMVLLSQLRQGNPQEDPTSKSRRRTALAWVDSLRQGSAAYETWDTKPSELDGAHWDDLKIGSLFFSTRDAAIKLLDVLEVHIAKQTACKLRLAEPIPLQITRQIDELRNHARAYATLGHAQNEAKEFCSECLESDNARVLAKLVGRDGRVLQLRNGHVVPGPAFKGKSEAVTDVGETADEPSNTGVNPQTRLWPDGISRRVNNLFMLNADLHGDMYRWMNNHADGDEE